MNKELEKVYNQYKKEKSENPFLLKELREILSGKTTLLGISPEDWNANLYDSHAMLYDWIFAKKHGLIKKVGIFKDSDIEDVVTVPTKLGEQMYELLSNTETEKVTIPTESYIITPQNEGQDLNYTESYHGSLDSAKARADDMARRLQEILKDGTISAMVENLEGETLYNNRRLLHS